MMNSEHFEALAMKNFPSLLALHERFAGIGGFTSFSNLPYTSKTEISGLLVLFFLKGPRIMGFFFFF